MPPKRKRATKKRPKRARTQPEEGEESNDEPLTKRGTAKKVPRKESAESAEGEESAGEESAESAEGEAAADEEFIKTSPVMGIEDYLRRHLNNWDPAEM